MADLVWLLRQAGYVLQQLAEDLDRMNTCDTCRHWDQGPYVPGEITRRCNNPRIGYRDPQQDSISLEGYEVEGITTGPKFGCVHHEAKYVFAGADFSKELKTILSETCP